MAIYDFCRADTRLPHPCLSYAAFFLLGFFLLMPVQYSASGSDKNSLLDIWQSSNVKALPSHAVITSHHLPTALPFIMKAYKSIAGSVKGKTIIILSPDHFEACRGRISTAEKIDSGPDIDYSILKDIRSSGFAIDDGCIAREHGLTAQAGIIKTLFPKNRIIPFSFSCRTSDQDLANLAWTLRRYSNRIFILASLDFSHYHDFETAIRRDEQTAKKISRSDRSYSLDEVDSPPVLRFLIDWATFGHLKPRIIGRANSYNFTGQKNNTTGYINAIFN